MPPNDDQSFDFPSFSLEFPDDLLGTLRVIREIYSKLLTADHDSLEKEAIAKIFVKYREAVFYSLLWIESDSNKELNEKRQAIFEQYQKIFQEVIVLLHTQDGYHLKKVLRLIEQSQIPYKALNGLAEDLSAFVGGFAQFCAKQEELADHKRTNIVSAAVVPIVIILIFSHAVPAIAVCVAIVLIALWCCLNANPKRGQDSANAFIQKEKACLTDLQVELQTLKTIYKGALMMDAGIDKKAIQKLSLSKLKNLIMERCEVLFKEVYQQQEPPHPFSIKRYSTLIEFNIKRKKYIKYLSGFPNANIEELNKMHYLPLQREYHSVQELQKAQLPPRLPLPDEVGMAPKF